MHLHVRIHHWVLWWFYVGVVVGVVALVNILFRNLTRTQDHVILAVGFIHWTLGGIVCWAFDGIRLQKKPPGATQEDEKPLEPDTEWHPASDFLFPGGRKGILPPRRR